MNASFVFYTTRGDYSREDVAARFPKDLELATRGISGLDFPKEGLVPRIAFPDIVVERRVLAHGHCKAVGQDGAGCVARAVRIKKIYSKAIDSRLILPAKHVNLTERIVKLTKSNEWRNSEASKETLVAYLSQRMFDQVSHKRSFVKCSSCGSRVSVDHLFQYLMKPDCPVCFRGNSLLTPSQVQSIDSIANKILALMIERESLERTAREKVWLKIGGDQQWEWYVGCWVPNKVPAERDGIVHSHDVGTTVHSSFQTSHKN